ncbi:MAG: asparagine synthase (glutamine-hydrolyzing) [Kiritimatiellae bacterium]|nr:asparagine synthase (glutamine-hydrolyzing) [Kiritimatiellia bacterium]
MCGIAGYYGTCEIGEDRVRECLALMRRRGPDHAGVYAATAPGGRRVCLLHSRLSIIDLDERANQPFRAESRVLVYNGELYNYVERRANLVKAGVSFRTESDTEVLLATLARSGWEGLKDCEGMWAFACYAERDGALLLSRDRFGEKPLYLFRDQTGLYFGSEVKFIMALLGYRPPVNFAHLYRYLVNGYKSLYKGRESFFVGVSELAPGAALLIDAFGQERQERYWRFDLGEEEALTFRAATERTRELLTESVRLRLRSDVPLAFCLSGGVDSNALIAVARKVFGFDVHGFTIVNSDARYDEQDMVQCSVDALGIRHTAIPVQTTEFLPRLRTLVRQHDAPVYTITYYAQWLLLEAVARSGYRVSISGSAADELFSGYFDHHLFYLADIAGDAKRFERSVANWEAHIRPIVRNPCLQHARVFVDSPGRRDHVFLDADRFAEYLRVPWSEDFAEREFPTGLLRKRMLNELFHEAVPVILHEDDLNAMYYSVENRSPYLDSRLFEFTLRIPTRHLIRNGAAKAVLREAMRGIVPDPVLDNRRKVGFNAPIRSFLDTSDPHVRACLLDNGPIFEHVRRDKIELLMAEENLPNSKSKFLFYFLSSKMFLEELG